MILVCCGDQASSPWFLLMLTGEEMWWKAKKKPQLFDVPIPALQSCFGLLFLLLHPLATCPSASWIDTFLSATRFRNHHKESKSKLGMFLAIFLS